MSSDSRLVDFFKTKTAAEVDTVLRMMQIVDEDTTSTSKEVQEIGMSLDFLLAELMSNKNFQFVQALMQLFLKVSPFCLLYILTTRQKSARVSIVRIPVLLFTSIPSKLGCNNIICADTK